MNSIHHILREPIKRGKDSFIADSATVIGNVELGDETSVWFGAVIRGDRDAIRIGKRSNVQDNAVIHVDPGFPTHIGDECIIGHCAIVHGATLGNNVLVGMNATILNGAKVGNFCVIGANALVASGMEIPDYSIVKGIPARVKGELDEAGKQKVRQNAQTYVELSKEYLKAFKKEK